MSLPVRPLRPLLIAEAANPDWVSVPLVGWSHAAAIRKRLPGAHLVTQVRNRDAILRAGWVEGQDFTAIDSEAVARPLTKLAEKLRGGKGKGWTTKMAVNAMAMPYFWKLAWQQFGPRLRAGEFDFVHHLTPLSPTITSSLGPKVRELGLPFVWGPLNGGVPWPKEFDAERRAEKEWLSYVRDAYRLMPGYLSTRRSASAILVASRDTLAQMPRSVHGKCIYLPENAIDPARFSRRRNRTATLPLKVVFLGRLVPYKGCDMLLDAAAPLVRDGKLTIDVLGDGPELPKLKAIAAREKIEAGVTFVGWVNHAQVQDRLVDADVFAFPSIREFGGGVAVEAMAVGVPPVVVAYGGLAELVTDRTGWLIPIGPRASIVSNLRNTLARLCDHPAEIDARSTPAWRRAHEQFTWDAKAACTLQVYDWVVGRRATKPDFGMPIPDVVG
jgi:glycosyltransferase involved in cell wall biosynthesis